MLPRLVLLAVLGVIVAACTDGWPPPPPPGFYSDYERKNYEYQVRSRS